MIDPIKTILLTCMGVKPGERVFILSDTYNQDVGRYVYNGARGLAQEHAFSVDFEIMNPVRISGEEPPAEIAEKMGTYDVILLLTTISLSHTNARRNACKAGARVASMPKVTREILDRAMAVDYLKIKTDTERLARSFAPGSDMIRITSSNGTDLCFSIKNRSAWLDTGIYDQAGAFGNLPAGEICFSPIEDSAHGTAVIDGSIGLIGKVNSTKLFFEQGKVVRAEGDAADTILAQLQTAADRTLAEFGIGTNPAANRSGAILEDEKVLGTAHIALGDNTSYTNAKRQASVHFDGVIRCPTVYVDGRMIIENGSWR